MPASAWGPLSGGCSTTARTSARARATVVQHAIRRTRVPPDTRGRADPPAPGTSTSACSSPSSTSPPPTSGCRRWCAGLQPHGLDVVIMDVDSPIRARERLQGAAQAPEPRRPRRAVAAARRRRRLPPRPGPVPDRRARHVCTRRCRRSIIDDVGGGRAAANYMLSLGHRRIAFLGEPAPQPVRLRLELAARGRLPGRPAVPPGIGGRDPAHGTRRTRRAAARSPGARPAGACSNRPTAIVASSDVQAIGVLDAGTRARDRTCPASCRSPATTTSTSPPTSTSRRSASRSPTPASAAPTSSSTRSPTPPTSHVHVEELAVEVIARGTTGPLNARRRQRIG